jgi:hypothetical protein
LSVAPEYGVPSLQTACTAPEAAAGAAGAALGAELCAKAELASRAPTENINADSFMRQS